MISYNFFSFLLTWEIMGAEISKYYSSLKSLLNLFKLFLIFLLSGSHKSTVLDFLNFEFMIFNKFLKFTIILCGEIKNLNYISTNQLLGTSDITQNDIVLIFSILKFVAFFPPN